MWFQQTLRTDVGFTLIEMLLSLLVFNIVMLLVVPLFYYSSIDLMSKEGIDIFEWEVFVQQWKDEVRLAKTAYVTSSVLVVEINSSDHISFEQYGGILRRRVNGLGHTVMLQKIADVTFEIHSAGVSIHVIDREGKAHHAYCNFLNQEVSL
ncbi:hypothetical protein EJF36_13595 [Bacillus sp. HMF5848]|uniref:competence type IV pilus minor pilin ComGF n=1 Tax=Bacillus sp. HMF5848 TaxID=2495421 RepID=UPI000F79442A|nr:competence type IV pilus minor pilin ComGF [Bacillus sp. HMF5848]RSK27826.1 hypothetical protein EJF36_13595 [Bacillus sp. HMF5848]